MVINCVHDGCFSRCKFSLGELGILKNEAKSYRTVSKSPLGDLGAKELGVDV